MYPFPPSRIEEALLLIFDYGDQQHSKLSEHKTNMCACACETSSLNPPESQYGGVFFQPYRLLNVGIISDKFINVNNHVTCTPADYHLKNICSRRLTLPQDASITVVHTIVTSCTAIILL